MMWQRVDGSLLGENPAAIRVELEAHLARHSIPAVLDFYPYASELVGVRFVVDSDGRVAKFEEGKVTSGLELEELAEDLAARFDLDVLIGDVAIQEAYEEPEEEPEIASGAAGEPETDPGADEPDLLPLRAVTITHGQEEYFGALAKRLGQPVTISSVGPHHVILTENGEQVPGIHGWEEQALPVVQILAIGPDRTVVAQSDEMASTTLAWGTERVVVAGSDQQSEETRAILSLIDNDDDDARVIASASPTAEVEQVKAALSESEESGPRSLLFALGLGPEYGDFLDGELAADEFPLAKAYEPRTAAQAIRETLQDAADDVADLKMVELAVDFEQRWPALARTLTISKAALGSGLLVAALRTKRPWKTAGAIAGALLVLDSFADVALYDFLSHRGRK